METMYFHLPDKVWPHMLQELTNNSDFGPYDDDGDTKPYRVPDHEANRLLNLRTRIQTQQPKSS